MQKLSYLFFIFLIVSITSNIFPIKTFAKPVTKSEKNILVLHSYHQGLEWTDSITSGIQSILGKRQDVNVVFEYLDTKRNFNDEYFTALQSLHQVKAKQIPFSVIITSDNAAFDFIKKYGDKYYPNVPVIYCGVNNLNPKIVKKYPHFWGAGEEADHFGTLSAIKNIFPNRKNLLIINDNTLTGKAIRVGVEDALEKLKNDFNYEIISEFTLQSIQERLQDLDSTYVVYLLVLNRDKNGTFISYRNGINHIKDICKVPVFGSWDFYLNKGLFGGSITSGSKQGRYTANIALNIIDHTFSDHTPRFKVIESDYYFDYPEMEKYNITEDQLPINSIILNQPSKTNLILRISIISIIILSSIVFVLIIWLKLKQKRAKELQKLVEEKTCKLNETNQELEKVIQNKDKFFSILAHDLRGSVAVLLNLSTFINSEEYEVDEEQRNEFDKGIFHVATRTSSLLEDLFYWGINQAKGGPEINYSFFDLNKVLQEMTKTFQINLNEVNINITNTINEQINSDLNICKFIFRNIIQNAIKYSGKGTCISISTFTKDNLHYIEVKDQGLGMSRETIDSIYQKCPIRLEGLSGQKTTGLGLPTVLDYLDLLDGKLLIDSELNKGSTFTIVLKNNN